MASNTPIVFDALELDLCIEFRQILQTEAGQAALRDWVAAGTVHIKVAVTTENAQVSILQLPGRLSAWPIQLTYRGMSSNNQCTI